jgi:hypothetical protein
MMSAGGLIPRPTAMPFDFRTASQTGPVVNVPQQ